MPYLQPYLDKPNHGVLREEFFVFVSNLLVFSGLDLYIFTEEY